MTAELNRQRVLNMFEMFYAGDVEGALARCTDDVEFFSNAPIDIIPHLGGHRGIPALRGMWETVHQRYKDIRYEIGSMVAEDDKVAVLIRLFFRKRSNDRTVQFDLAVFYTLRGGKVAQIREVIDTFDLVEQVLERDLSALLTGRPVGGTQPGDRVPSSPFLVRRVNPCGIRGDPALGRPGGGRFRQGTNEDLVLLGLFLGALGGAALGAGLAWVEIFKTSSFEGYSGMLVFFGFMPGGAILGSLAGAAIFGVLALRDAKIPIEQPPRNPGGS